MTDDTDDPYQLPTEEELAHPDEYWWHSWLIDPIKRGDLCAIQQYLARNPEGLHTECPSYFDPFIVAAQQPAPDALRLLLEHWAAHPTPGAPPPNERGSSLFNVACAHGVLETARYLLDEQPALAGLHARSGHGRTPILEAAASLVSCAMDEQSEMMVERAGRARLDAQAARERVHRSEALVGLLLDRGACARDSMGYTDWDTGPAVVDSDGDMDTVFSLAIARAGPALLRRLMDEGADAFVTTSDRSHHIFGYLFENSGTSGKLTLLHLAAFYGNYPGVQVLMEHYAQRGLDMADVTYSQDQFGRLPIHYAAAGWPGDCLDTDSTDTYTDTDNYTTALLRILTDSGNPRLTNAPDQYSETPLHYALSPNLITGRAAIAVARFLCTDLHASARLRGRGGETPLHRLCHGRPHHASCSIDTRLAALLLNLDQDLAADVKAVDDAGNTPLHLAVRCLAHVPAAGFLLGRGADVRTRNKRGRTPLHEAAGGQYGLATVSVEESIRAQDAMLAVLCGSAEEELTLEKKWNALLDEQDVDGKTLRQIVEETRAAWREDEAQRGRGRGGRG
ncbi:hypothetical protein VSDG_06838 [Cytospora chrysosperma]|uniref:Uncharacterized protein n=1 Tax=Cytospora chrysosperma TaxID=252740 RepID=A0A423VQH3_CYTCH|nr:hypothetical protein VSDG_06838 [Valsa sordida]